MSIPVKYAQSTGYVALPGGTRARVIKGQHWPAADPVVQAAPDMFTDDPRFGLVYSVEPDGYDAPLETASATPGERRTTRRPPATS